MNLLLLSCGTGGGHNAAAQAIKEQAETMGHKAVFLNYLSLAGKQVSKDVNELYIDSVRYVPSLFGLVYRLGSLISHFTNRSPVYYANGMMARYLKQYLKKHSFDAIIMPHLYPAETITYMKHHGCRLPMTIAIATDYTCIPFWGETDCDYYIVPGSSVSKEFIEAGIPNNKLIPIGIPVSMQYKEKITQEEARNRLKLPQNKEIYLLLGGSMAAGNIKTLLRQLLMQSKKNSRILVVCGNNEKLRVQLVKQYRRISRVLIIGYTKHIPLYLKACDAVFTKPGGLTSTEAAAAGTCLIHTKPIPGCETKNRRYFIQHGMSISGHTATEQVYNGLCLVKDEKAKENMLAAQRTFISGNAAEKIIHFIANKGAER